LFLDLQGLGVSVWDVGFRAQGSRFRVQGSGFRVQGSGFRVWSLGFRVYVAHARDEVPCADVHTRPSFWIGV